MDNEKAALIAEFLEKMQQLSYEQQEDLLAFMRMLNGEFPSDPLMALRLKRLVIKALENGVSLPDTLKRHFTG